MEAKFTCQVCSINGDISWSSHKADSPGSRSFDSGLNFLDHLKRYHLVVKATQHGKLYFCCYGPSGCCTSQLKSPTAPNSEYPSQSVFSSQREYEHHLLSHHLLQPVSLFGSHLSSSTGDACNHSTHHSPIKWSVYHSVVNLPAILNDPTHRQTDIFSRTWGEHFERTEVTPSPRLPVIDEGHFHEYLKKLSSRKLSTLTTIHRPRKVSLPTTCGSELPRRSLHPSSTLSSTDSVSLDTIPSMLFDSSFSLQDRHTFSQLIPLHPRYMERMTSFDKDVDASKRRQEDDFLLQHNRLANYLDVVEVHLAEQVSKKSSTFFEAVCCHDVVREQLCQALTQAKRVRDQLHRIDSNITQPGMRLHRMVRRRANSLLLLEKLKIIASLQTVQPTIQLLLRGSDFCAALELITSTQDLLESLNRPVASKSLDSTAPLQHIICLRHLDAQILEVARLVRQMIEAEFEAALRQLLRPQSLDQPYSGSDLVSSLLGLLLIKRHDFVSAFRAELIHQVKHLHLHRSETSVVEPDASRSDSTTKDSIRCMPNEQWLNLIEIRCTELKDLLSRGKEVVSLIVDAMSRCSSSSTAARSSQPSSTLMPMELEHLTTQLHLALRSACGVVQSNIVDLVASRERSCTSDVPNGSSSTSETSQNDSSPLDMLSVNDFVRLLVVLEDLLEFIEQSPTRRLSNSVHLNGSVTKESPSGVADVVNEYPSKFRMGGLGRLIIQLIRRATHRFHMDRVSKLEMVLNQERWQAVPVPSYVQNLVNRTFAEQCQNEYSAESASSDHSQPSATHPRKNYSKPVFELTDKLETFGKDGQVNSCLVLGGERFVVVGTVLMLLPILVDYCSLGEQLPCKPGSVFEVINRVAELLNTFNSRTCQLVLGAEALRSADLQTISARNLALASRSLQLIVRCIPILRLRLESLIDSSASQMNWPSPSSSMHSNYGQKDALKHVESLFREHIDQIADKLFNLLSNRIQDRLSVWQIRPPTPSPEFRMICRALKRMVEMTNDVLPDDILNSIILRAHDQFKVHLRHRLSELSVVADGGPKQSLVDSELAYYASQLRTLSHEFTAFSDDLDTVWPTS